MTLFLRPQTKARLETAEAEGAALREQLRASRGAEERLRDRLAALERERDHAALLQKERDDALAKLGVLAQYYEEKETQLKK